MKPVEEMFLKAADFRIIERNNGECTAIGCSFKSAGDKYGSYMIPMTKTDDPHVWKREDYVELFKTSALHHILSRIGCHA